MTDGDDARERQAEFEPPEKDQSTTDGRSEPSRTRRGVLAAAGTASVGLLAGCLGGDGSSGGNGDGGSSGGNGGGEGSGDGSTDGGGDEMDAAGSWQEMELTNVLTDEQFTVAELTGPVVLHTFAVWCPKCDRQQGNMETLTESDDEVTVVSLNVDPNEDAEKVRTHAEENGYDWYYAVSPSEMTRSLVDEFGNVVTNPPSTPVISVCPDGSAQFVDANGIKSVSTIQSQLDEC